MDQDRDQLRKHLHNTKTIQDFYSFCMKYHFYGDLVNSFLVAHYLHKLLGALNDLLTSGLTIRTSTFCSVIIEDENYVSQNVHNVYIIT